jgi:SnoaL-like domain
MEVSELIALYNRAWSEPNYALRQKLLEQIWAEDGTYTDPTAHVAGRKALVDHIEAFFAQLPGAHFVVTSGIDSHHGKFRFTWRMVLADGKVALEGIDFGELNSDGSKLHRIVGFFGPLAQTIG